MYQAIHFVWLFVFVGWVVSCPVLCYVMSIHVCVFRNVNEADMWQWQVLWKAGSLNRVWCYVIWWLFRCCGMVGAVEAFATIHASIDGGRAGIERVLGTKTAHAILTRHIWKNNCGPGDGVMAVVNTRVWNKLWLQWQRTDAESSNTSYTFFRLVEFNCGEGAFLCFKLWALPMLATHRMPRKSKLRQIKIFVGSKLLEEKQMFVLRFLVEIFY